MMYDVILRDYGWFMEDKRSEVRKIEKDEWELEGDENDTPSKDLFIKGF